MAELVPVGESTAATRALSLRSQVEKLRADLEAREAELADFQAKLKQASKDVQSIKTKLDVLQKQHAAADAKVITELRAASKKRKKDWEEQERKRLKSEIRAYQIKATNSGEAAAYESAGGGGCEADDDDDDDHDDDDDDHKSLVGSEPKPLSDDEDLDAHDAALAQGEGEGLEEGEIREVTGREVTPQEQAGEAANAGSEQPPIVQAELVPAVVPFEHGNDLNAQQVQDWLQKVLTDVNATASDSYMLVPLILAIPVAPDALQPKQACRLRGMEEAGFPVKEFVTAYRCAFAKLPTMKWMLSADELRAKLREEHKNMAPFWWDGNPATPEVGRYIPPASDLQGVKYARIQAPNKSLPCYPVAVSQEGILSQDMQLYEDLCDQVAILRMKARMAAQKARLAELTA
tara:strand:+ start:828 stop:2042 length:1215 start_codon:yes stop_codon:yes gene_type:complete